MNIILPATITAKLTDFEQDEEDFYSYNWVEVTLFFGTYAVHTWRVYPKDTPILNVDHFLDDGEYGREAIESFVAKKLQELWFPKEPS